MVIDSHQHFWNYDPQTYSWITDQMKVLRRNFLPGDLEPLLKREGIDGCIAVQADSSEAETEFLLQLAKSHPFIKGVVGWVDLLDENVGERLQWFASNPLLKGIRHIVQDEPDNEFMLRADFQDGIARLQEYGLSYDILVYPHQLHSAILLARKFPEQRFILDHLAKPRISEGLDAKWLNEINSLSRCPNVCCKVSGMVTETLNYTWDAHDFNPYMEAVFNAFGTDRVLFGSDWPVCLLAAGYSEVVQIIRNYLKTFSKEDQAKVMGLNAVAWYQLDT